MLRDKHVRLNAKLDVAGSPRSAKAEGFLGPVAAETKPRGVWVPSRPKHVVCARCALNQVHHGSYSPEKLAACQLRSKNLKESNAVRDPAPTATERTAGVQAFIPM